MEAKKNPSKDQNRKSVLYFAIGLVLVLALIYLALEWKLDDDNGGFDIGANPNKEIIAKDSTIVLETRTTIRK